MQVYLPAGVVGLQQWLGQRCCSPLMGAVPGVDCSWHLSTSAQKGSCEWSGLTIHALCPAFCANTKGSPGHQPLLRVQVEPMQSPRTQTQFEEDEARVVMKVGGRFPLLLACL